MTMMICEYEFLLPDRGNEDYSMTEIDYYSHLPFNAQIPHSAQHRLTLRKNIKEQKFEAIKVFTKWQGSQKQTTTIVAFSDSDLAKVVAYCRAETVKFWGKDYDTKDQICQHKPPLQRYNCEKLHREIYGAAP